MITIEEIKWKSVPTDRPDSLEGELNRLDAKSKLINDPDFIIINTDSGNINLKKKLSIMDSYIQQALKIPHIEDIEWESKQEYRKLSESLLYIFNVLKKMNKIDSIYVDEKTSLSSKLNKIDSLLNDSYRGQSIETIKYQEVPQGHKSTLKEELESIYDFISSIKKDTVIRDNQSLSEILSKLEDNVNILMQRTNILPIINKFYLVNDIYEIGQTISVLEVRWEANKVFKSGQILIDSHSVADINDYLQMDFIPSSGSLLVPNLTLRSTKEISIELIDEYGTSATNTTEVRFYNRVLYGAVPFNSKIDQELLERILKSPLTNNPYHRNFKVNCGEYGDLVPLIAIPHEWGIESYQIQVYNAGNYNLWEHKVVSYTNYTGYNSLYDVYIVNQPLSGNVLISILDYL